MKRLAIFYFLFLAAVAARAEIRAVWDHSGSGLYPGNWPKTMRVLQKSHVTDLFVNVGGVDFAHYASSFLPRSYTFSTKGDQLAACLTAARGTGIRVHAWFICFNATRASSPVHETFRRRGWRLKDERGTSLSYLDPSNPDVRAYVLTAVDELQTRYPVHGVHLDFVRWGDAAVKPPDAANAIERFVAEARRRVKRPKLLTTAVYGKYPACVASVGQNWPRWLKYDLVDYVMPMDYAPTLAKFRDLLQLQRPYARRIVVGIGVTANESNLSGYQVSRQIGLARQYGFAGQALFDLDEKLEKEVLPALRRGTW